MEKSIMKRILSLALALVICLSAAVTVSAESGEAAVGTITAPKLELSQNQQNIVDRADYLYGITWVAQKTVSAHAYSYYYTYYAGNTYHLPYGQGDTSYYIGYGVDPEVFRARAADANSVFYQYKSYAGSWYSTYYISDCSGFVSWCWGLTYKQSTRSLGDYSTWIGYVNTSNIYNKLKVGDALNRYDYHVVLVTDMIYDSAGNLTGIEITEQTIPETRRTVYTPSGLADAYASYDGIYRYNGTVPECPVKQEKEETWIEKACFDTMVYRDRNADIAHLSDAELKEHWLSNGIKEGRAASPVLDLGFYANNNPDVKEACTKDGVVDYEAVYNHFINNGYKEKRKSSALFDGAYYCSRYPDVASSYKDEYLRHYVENGIYEGRRASLTFDPDYYWFIRPDVAEAWPGDYQMCAKHYAGHGIVEQIEAYDHEYPVISNAVISDVSADGYTVTCTVTDNWGLSRVSFPTWTVLNDQDDLADDFMNTQQGTQNGSTYTFRVNAADHNNEGGAYVTHIYARDKGGNQVSLALSTVEVKDTLDQITLTASSSYTRSAGKLYDVQPGTTVDTFLAQFENEVLEVVNAGGSVITGAALVGTGTKVNLYDDGVLIDTVTVIVLGDVNGNGIVNADDSAMVKSFFLRKLSLTDVQTEAADVDKNQAVNTTDYTRLRAHILGKYNLFA